GGEGRRSAGRRRNPGRGRGRRMKPPVSTRVRGPPAGAAKVPTALPGRSREMTPARTPSPAAVMVPAPDWPTTNAATSRTVVPALIACVLLRLPPAEGRALDDVVWQGAVGENKHIALTTAM